MKNIELEAALIEAQGMHDALGAEPSALTLLTTATGIVLAKTVSSLSDLEDGVHVCSHATLTAARVKIQNELDRGELN